MCVLVCLCTSRAQVCSDSAEQLEIIVQWNPSITDTTGTKGFVLHSEVSFAQGVIVDHAPLTVVANYAEARLWIIKSVVLIKDLLISTP